MPVLCCHSIATEHLTTCGTILVDRHLKYITSQQLWTLQCFSSSLQEVEISFETHQNLKIKLHLTLISGHKDPLLFMNNSSYVIHGSDDIITSIVSMGNAEFDGNHITLVMNQEWRDNIVLIGFQGEFLQSLGGALYMCSPSCYVFSNRLWWPKGSTFHMGWEERRHCNYWLLP